MPTGFDRYQRFYTTPPAIVVEWHDDQTSARGWLAINSLRGGAAGGGTRMRVGGSKQEAVFLAKTMGVKFFVCGPDIGGGKSVIDFDPNTSPDVKRGVLERWYRHIAPYLRSCYGTGGDVGVDEIEAANITKREIGIAHVQEGIVRGHFGASPDGEAIETKIARLKPGTEARVVLPDLAGPADDPVRRGAWTVADVATGLGVVRSIERYAKDRNLKLAGQRAIIEGFGAVGAFAAYYLDKLGVSTVGISSRLPNGKIRVARCDSGMTVLETIVARPGTDVPASVKGGTITESAAGDELFGVRADIFVPAAASHTITLARVKMMREAGVKLVSCGANNPFFADRKKATLAEWVEDMLAVAREADENFAIIPDFIANSGMARVFGYLMSKGGKVEAAAILDDITAMMDRRVDDLLRGYSGETGLLNHGCGIFVPER